ncbi:hypothetical protein ACL9RF_17575 [Sphingobacterium sp. Mn56C]|uniref:hypothetical protein n=1 Tax=Sphingobacterium sp. Mn56C TaxID=3395261 RepID=UPI003BC22E29
MNQSINAPKKKSKALGCLKIFIGIMIVGAVIGFIQQALMSDEEKAQQEIERASEKAKKDSLDYAEEQNRAVRMKLIKAEIHSEELLKKTLKDPKSYEKINVESGYSKDSSIVVNLTYRATNSFGGYIQEEKQFVYSKDGKLKDIHNK